MPKYRAVPALRTAPGAGMFVGNRADGCREQIDHHGTYGVKSRFCQTTTEKILTSMHSLAIFSLLFTGNDE